MIPLSDGIRVRRFPFVNVALIVANNHLESEIVELMKAVSHAYTRGRFRTYSG